MKGSDVDRKDAIDEIRKERYEVTQKELNDQIKEQKKELEKEKKDLDDLKGKKKPGL